MAEYAKCMICGEFGWLNAHVCAPSWSVSVEGGPDQFFRDYSAEGAAEKAAALYDQDEGSCANGREIEVTVTSAGGEKTYFRVEGEIVATYHAHEANPALELI